MRTEESTASLWPTGAVDPGVQYREYLPEIVTVKALQTPAILFLWVLPLPEPRPGLNLRQCDSDNQLFTKERRQAMQRFPT